MARTTTRARRRAKVTRRSTDEVRGLILEAASHLFAENGYQQTTMRAIAEEARISLSVLYRQFPSKERLFSETFVAPFAESFGQFSASWGGGADGAAEVEAQVGDFVRQLYRSLLPHRRTIVTLLAAGENPDAKLVKEARDALSEAWRELLVVAPRVAERGDSPDLVRDTTMLAVAMVSGLVLFDPWVSVARGNDDAEALVELAAGLADQVIAPTDSKRRSARS